MQHSQRPAVLNRWPLQPYLEGRTMKRILIAFLFLATPCIAGDDRADEAISDALDLLQSRRAKLTEQAELAKLDLAIERLMTVNRQATLAPVQTRRVTSNTETPADRPPSLLPSVKIADFIDHTERYKGQIVTLPLMVRSRALIPQGQTLRDLAAEQRDSKAPATTATGST